MRCHDQLNFCFYQLWWNWFLYTLFYLKLQKWGLTILYAINASFYSMLVCHTIFFNILNHTISKDYLFLSCHFQYLQFVPLIPLRSPCFSRALYFIFNTPLSLDTPFSILSFSLVFNTLWHTIYYISFFF